jgi:competence protein ComEC
MRFLFDVERLDFEGQWQSDFPRRVRLSWYEDTPELKLAQRWRLTVRLKHPRGFINPGGFDYEGWLFRKGIRASGYVRPAEDADLITPRVWERPVGLLRQSLADSIETALGADANRGVITALAIGDRTAMSPRQWSLLLATGTNHLLAISGLHIGLVAGLIYLVAFRAWRLSGRLCMRLPAQHAAAWLALIAGCFYALLAGFSVPTQRAAIMLCVVMGAVISNRATRPAQTLSIALLAVLIWDPLAVLSSGFWLSFAAVAWIFYTVGNRPVAVKSLWRWGRIQWVLAIGLFPLILLFFQRVSLIAPLANLVAVPWVGLLVVPFTLLGSISISSVPVLGELLLAISSALLDLLWAVLELLVSIPLAQWYHTPPAWTLLPALIGAALLLAPRGLPGRWLGIVFISPIVLNSAPRPEPGAYWLTTLDVGQGLAMVVETPNHVLVYDTGARFSDYFNAGEAVVTPYLRSRGIENIDLLMISHGDNDHIGGVEAVFNSFQVQKVLSSVPELIDHPQVSPCVAGQRWVWDEVQFEVLHPPSGWQGSKNNRSCVLRIGNPGGASLITADIEKAAETQLLESTGIRLNSDIMLIPHHGSRSSSSQAFINAVAPEVVLLPLGYRNRFGFPDPEVMDRYGELGVTVLDTVNQGAITISVHQKRGLEIHPGARQIDKRYWSAVSRDVQPYQ